MRVKHGALHKISYREGDSFFGPIASDSVVKPLEVSIGVGIRSHIQFILQILAFYYDFKVTALKIRLKDNLMLLQAQLMIEVIKDYILFVLANDLKRTFFSQLIP